MAGTGLLLNMTDIDPSVEEAFNDWYDHEHVPQITRVPGILNGRRFRALEGEPRYAAAYDLETVDALQHPEYLAARASGPSATPLSRQIRPHFRGLIRGVYRLLVTLPAPGRRDADRAGGLLLVGFDVNASDAEAAGRWHVSTYLPALANAVGAVRARGFELHRGGQGLEGEPSALVGLLDLVTPADGTLRTALDAAESLAWRNPNFPILRQQRNLYEQVLPA